MFKTYTVVGYSNLKITSSGRTYSNMEWSHENRTYMDALRAAVDMKRRGFDYIEIETIGRKPKYCGKRYTSSREREILECTTFDKRADDSISMVCGVEQHAK